LRMLDRTVPKSARDTGSDERAVEGM
jgi:hypothetical protein